MNITDAEIEKALEYCLEKEVNCEGCTYEEYSKKDCTIRLYKDTLDLINRLKAKEKEQYEEIERLKYNLKAVLDERADHSEAIKEFAHLIIDKIDSGLITHSADIPDCVVEFLEMTENEGKE